MKIIFKSTNKPPTNEKEVFIEYKSRVEKEVENDLTILTFEEDREGNKITNRFEFTDQTLHIFSGALSLFCRLNSIEKNEVIIPELPSKIFYIYIKMTDIIIKENYYNFKYLISNKEEIIEDDCTKINIELTLVQD